MSSETLTSVHLQRYEIISSRPFDDVVRAIRAGLGHPDFAALVRKLPTLTDWTGFQAEVAANVGEAGLMVFMELDLGAVVALDPQAHPFKAIRIIAGNPVTMESMVRSTPGAGVFAPVTILIFESSDGVHIRYDSLSSAVGHELTDDSAPYALALDEEVLNLIREAGD